MAYTFIAMKFKISRFFSVDLNYHGHFELGFGFVMIHSSSPLSPSPLLSISQCYSDRPNMCS